LLTELTLDQGGCFAQWQARKLGFTRPRLQHHLNTGKLERLRRGIYRFRHYPSDPREEFIVLWLWSHREGLFSHETALMLHELSDSLPSKVHLTVPRTWKSRRLALPPGVVLHFDEVPSKDRAWRGLVPVTSVLRTLRDCATGATSPDLLRQALSEARAKGLIGAHDFERTRRPK
jgi:predicted transcriptional regulator of viral defense system